MGGVDAVNASRALAAEQAVALTAGVARDLIGQGAGKGLPRPRFLIALFAFYGALGLVAAFGRTPARVAVAFGGVAALTTVAVGPGGIALADLFKNLSGLTTAGTGATSTSGAGSSASPPSPAPSAGYGGPNVNPVPGVSAPITGGYRSAGIPTSPITGKPDTTA